MIAILGLLVWTILMMLAAGLSWIRMVNNLKVYLLIVYSAVFLTGAFCIYPFLKKLQ